MKEMLQDTSPDHKQLSISKLVYPFQVPRQPLLFVIPAFRGMVSWEGEGASFNESDQSITRQIGKERKRAYVDLLKESKERIAESKKS